MKNGHSFYSSAALRPLAVAGVVGVLAALLVTAFSWPASNVAPREVPIAVAGAPDAAAGFQGQLEERSPGSFDVEAVESEAAARLLIVEREVYGAVVLGPDGPTQVLIATGASPALARVLEAAFASSPSTASGVPIDDLAPLPADDPQGAGLVGALLPLTLTGVVTAVLGLRLIPRRTDRLTAAALSAFAVGTAVWLVLDPWLGAVGDGSSRGVWGTLFLGAAALSMMAAGAVAALGTRGLAIVAGAFILLGNPLSGSASAPELLPDGWSTLGQLFPQGAVTTLLRSAIAFDGAGTWAPILVLSGWIVLGLALFALGGWRARHEDRHTRDDSEPDTTASTETGARTVEGSVSR